MVRTCWRGRADMRGEDNISRQTVAGLGHRRDLERERNYGNRAVCVGNDSDLGWARTNSAELADDTERGSGAIGALEDELNEIGVMRFGGYPPHSDIFNAGVPQNVRNRLAIDERAIEQFVAIDDLLERHF